MTNVKAPKQPKRKLTPYERMEKAIKLHTSATRKLVAKLKSELKDMDPQANSTLEMTSAHDAMRGLIEVMEFAEREMKRGHVLYMSEQAYREIPSVFP